MNNKIIFGIPANIGLLVKNARDATNEDGYIEDYQLDDEEDIWCDFSLEYDYDDQCYKLFFETMIGFDCKEDCRNWIMTCCTGLEHYMIDHKLDTSRELSLYNVFTEGINVNSHFETIEDAYAFMKFVVDGFHGNDLFVSENH